MPRTFDGTVTRSTGSWYTVLGDDGRQTDCRIRGRIRLAGSRATNPVAVGDRVACEADDDGGCSITAVAPRRNYIIRRASNLSKESHVIAANVDRAAAVVTLFDPVTRREFLDRFLVTCEAYGVPAAIVLNKADLARREPEVLADFLDTYRGAGYRVLETSAAEGLGIGEFSGLLGEGVTLLAGNSGVGKSSLVRAVWPEADVKVGDISSHHRKGTHTTTFSRMYSLPSGGAVIDTPGIKGFGLIDIEPDEVARYFPDLMRRAPGCTYYNCTHTHEPGCAVLEAVERGEVAFSRYESYLKILDEDEKYRK